MPMDIMMTEIKNGKLEDAYLMGNWAYMIMQDSAGQDVVIDFLILGTYQLMNVDLGDDDVRQNMSAIFDNGGGGFIAG